jgi:hypothetical protein
MLLGFGSVRFKLIALDTDVGPPLLEYPVQGRLGEKKDGVSVTGRWLGNYYK